MGFRLAALLCAGALLSAGRARAGDGPDPASPARTIEYVEGRGVVFRTPDGLFEGSLGFNLQVRFTHADRDASAGGVDADEFRVRRFKLFLSGFALDPRLTWRVQLAFESTAADRTLEDAWLNWKFGPAFAIQGGQSKTPFTRQELFNDGVLQFPERSIAVDSFKPSRDVGVMAAGSFSEDRLGYQAGVFGGAGQNTLRATNHVMPMLRLVWNPIGSLGSGEADLQDHEKPALSFGANGFLNTLRKSAANTFEAAALNYAGRAGWLGRNVDLFTTGEDVDVQSWGFDAQFKWMGLSVQGEYLRGRAEGDASGVRLYAYGWYGQAGYFVLSGKLDLAVRYAYVDANRDIRRDGISTVSTAASYYFRKNNLKLVLDYTRIHRQRPEGAPANDQAFLVQAQLMP
jgi:phosphate-selective porin OprO and OprP